MINQKNRELLRKIMRDHGLTPDQVAVALDRSPWTVYQWRSGVANCPDHAIRLLQLMVATGQIRGAV